MHLMTTAGGGLDKQGSFEVEKRLNAFLDTIQEHGNACDF